MATASKKRYWVGFDLGGTKMLATVFDKDFKALGSRRKKTKDFKGSRAGLVGITKTIDDALQDAGISRKQVAGIGIGCPGALDLERGVVVQSPNLGWRNVALKKSLEKIFSCRVALANDVDAGTYGEYRFGAGQGARCLVGIFPGTGIGGACVYEGKIFRGQRSSCMEIGHMHMQPKGGLCGCGRWGCLETVASRLAISEQAAAAAFRGEAPHLYELAGTDLSSIRSRTLATAIKEGDVVIEAIVQHAAKSLGVATASLVNLLAPEVVVLGGGLVEAMPQIYLEQVRKAIHEQAMKPFRTSVRVAVAKLGDNAGVLGAAALVADEAHDRR